MKRIDTQKDMRPFAKWEAYSSAATKELQALKNVIRQIAGSAAGGIYKRTGADQVLKGMAVGIRCSLCLNTSMNNS